MNILRKLVKYWLPPLLWAWVIFYFSSLSVPQATQIYWQDFIVKKTAHVIEYGFLSILLYRGFINSGLKKRNSALFAIGLAIIYAASDEFHQSFTPGREPRVRDVVFDTIGAILSIYSIWNLLPKAPLKLRQLAKKLQVA